MKAEGIKYPEIRVEDFLIYYNRAYNRNNMRALNQLHDLYPEAARLAFDDEYISSRYDPADEEYCFRHPITLDSTRMTERRVMDMVAYLFCKSTAGKKYKEALRERVSFREVFNYTTDRYQKNYDRGELWEKFFLAFPELRRAIESRHIANLAELEYRAADYFEKYPYTRIG